MIVIAAFTLIPRDLPALAIGIVLVAYWWRVMRMAVRMRQKTGSAANLVPAEPLGRALRVVWQPVVWVWVGCPLVIAWVPTPRAAFFKPLYDIPALEWAAVVVGVAAYTATRVCWKRMGKSWRMGINPAEKTSLVCTGPYAFVRHPIYALSSLLMLTTVLTVPTPLMILAAALHLLLLQWEARREEQNLRRVHGHEYEDYRSRTGRFIPRVRRGYTPSPSTP